MPNTNDGHCATAAAVETELDILRIIIIIITANRHF